DLSDFTFSRSDPEEGYRSDRTMRTEDMIGLVDSLKMSGENSRAKMATGLISLMRGPVLFDPAPVDSLVASDSGRVAIADLDRALHRRVYDVAVTHARTSRAMLDDLRRGLEWEHQRADRFRVEIHKKYSIALACLIFVLIGAPLGLSIRRGGLGRAGALAVAVFLFYWVTLVQGEKLADRGFLTPWVGMWAANIVMTILGLWLMVYVSLDLRATPPLRTRLLQRLRSRE
ncbi:MAG: LptF/LptG family permease, partial [Rhodothermales bacterium]